MRSAIPALIFGSEYEAVMNQVTLSVQPATGGWWLDCSLPFARPYFRSGACVEAAARALAARLADGGCDVRLVINDRANQPVATQHYAAP